jgi:ceramide glucosyltransferase
LDRRVRWLRVRRYMVLAATMLEPTTESIICGLLGSFGFSIWVFSNGQIFSWWFFLLHMTCWCLIDYWQFNSLLEFKHVEHTDETPFFVTPLYSPDSSPSDNSRPSRRPFFSSWLPVWAARELLAFPIWVKAMCGHSIQWRNRPFRIKRDLTAEEIRN